MQTMEKLSLDAMALTETRGEFVHIYRGALPWGSEQNKRLYLALKRFADIVLSALGLALLSPVFLLIAVLIRIDSQRPVIYIHKRVGWWGRELRLYKFRTMAGNAQELFELFSPEQKAAFFENFKLEEDPRVTRIGKFLRRSSLDELPQLLNILQGDLSVVGPRPVVADELEKYGVFKDMFLRAKPGLTGYWQINGRSATTYADRMKMELHYIKNRSAPMDIAIFFRTFAAVLGKRGAL